MATGLLTKYATAAVVILALVSCGKDDLHPAGPEVTGANGDIIFEIGLTPQTRVVTAPDFTSTWDNGDAVGVFAVDHQQNLSASVNGNHIHNAKLTYNDGTWTQETPLYWPTTASGISSLDFYAYYPYDATATDPTAINFNVLADQNGTTIINGIVRPNYNLSDLLTAKSDNNGNGWNKADGTVSLQFSHALAMVQLTLDNTVGAIDRNEDLTVTLLGVKQGAELNLGAASGPEVSLATADNEGTNVTMYRVEQEGTTGYNKIYTYRALVPAQILAKDESIFRISTDRLLLDGSKLTVDKYLSGGQAEKFTQTIPWTAAKWPEANSYMAVPQGAEVYVPVSQANRIYDEGLGVTTTGLDLVKTDTYSVELVWSDRPVGPGGVIKEMESVTHDGKGYIRITPGVSGNAIIGIILNGETAFRWSWHIWVTEKVGQATDVQTGLTWMDRNLGAGLAGYYDPDGRNGLFYQWGRKDAFPASDGSFEEPNVCLSQKYYTPAAQDGTTAELDLGDYTQLYDMVQNPLIFSKATSFYGSQNIQVNNDSWGGVSGNKTIYDPCPPGWKVPPAMVDAVTNVWGINNGTDWPAEWKNGRVFMGVNGTASTAIFFPAAGMRNGPNGKISAVSIEGYYWSATPHTISTIQQARFLNLNAGNISQTGTGRRAAMAVRCIRE